MPSSNLCATWWTGKRGHNDTWARIVVIADTKHADWSILLTRRVFVPEFVDRLGDWSEIKHEILVRYRGDGSQPVATL
jgi:hypothetical protein